MDCAGWGVPQHATIVKIHSSPERAALQLALASQACLGAWRPCVNPSGNWGV
jgi:hypothetical protein